MTLFKDGLPSPIREFCHNNVVCKRRVENKLSEITVFGDALWQKPLYSNYGRSHFFLVELQRYLDSTHFTN